MSVACRCNDAATAMPPLSLPCCSRCSTAEVSTPWCYDDAAPYACLADAMPRPRDCHFAAVCRCDEAAAVAAMLFPPPCRCLGWEATDRSVACRCHTEAETAGGDGGAYHGDGGGGGGRWGRRQGKRRTRRRPLLILSSTRATPQQRDACGRWAGARRARPAPVRAGRGAGGEDGAPPYGGPP